MHLIWCDVWAAPAVAVLRISIHAPLGVRLAQLQKLSQLAQLFQSTHPCWVRLTRRSDIPSLPFNPSTHVGATVRHSAHICSLRISIHAPMLGATSHIPFVRFDLFISIHAPVWCDACLSSLTNGCNISIHAPVWGTTEHHCPACGLIGSHVVPNIPLVIELDNRTS